MRRLLRADPDTSFLYHMARYGAVVGSGYLLAVTFYSGELAVGVAPYAGLGIAFVLNGLYNFTLVRLWAFPPSGRRLHSDLGRFSLVAALSLIVNYGSFAVLYSVVALGALTAQRLAILIAGPVTFFANRFWAFRGPAIDRGASKGRRGAGNLGEE
jgi:putative flippase GtrA